MNLLGTRGAGLDDGREADEDAGCLEERVSSLAPQILSDSHRLLAAAVRWEQKSNQRTYLRARTIVWW